MCQMSPFPLSITIPEQLRQVHNMAEAWFVYTSEESRKTCTFIGSLGSPTTNTILSTSIAMPKEPRNQGKYTTWQEPEAVCDVFARIFC